MAARKIFRSSIAGLAAMFMAVASSVLFYTDNQLNQAGIGSPLGFGDRVSGTIALWLQPWLIAVSQLRIIEPWRLGLGAFTFLGACSGVVLAGLVAAAVWFWPRTFWPVTVLVSILAASTGGYAIRNFGILTDTRLHYHNLAKTFHVMRLTRGLAANEGPRKSQPKALPDDRSAD